MEVKKQEANHKLILALEKVVKVGKGNAPSVGYMIELIEEAEKALKSFNNANKQKSLRK